MHSRTDIEIEPPISSDGLAVHRLVASSPPLDTNSVYCNVLQCTHFKDTSICAKQGDDLVGFVSGYILPSQTGTLFIWQVAVAESVRGQGLALRMLKALLDRPSCREIEYLETTITPSNGASQALFRKCAESLAAQVAIGPGFNEKTHFDGEHESEHLWRIGPISKK